eukprot:11187505-Lingulodinium_polyedra.AAC.2
MVELLPRNAGVREPFACCAMARPWHVARNKSAAGDIAPRNGRATEAGQALARVAFLRQDWLEPEWIRMMMLLLLLVEGTNESMSQSVNQSISQSVSQSNTRYHSISLDITRYHSISPDITRYHSISLDITQHHSKSLNISQYRSRSVHITQ